MLEIAASEAQNTFETLLEKVESGEVVLITRNGQAVARLCSDSGPVDRTRALAAASRIRARAIELNVPFEWRSIKEDRDTGRP